MGYLGWGGLRQDGMEFWDGIFGMGCYGGGQERPPMNNPSLAPGRGGMLGDGESLWGAYGVEDLVRHHGGVGGSGVPQS